MAGTEARPTKQAARDGRPTHESQAGTPALRETDHCYNSHMALHAIITAGGKLPRSMAHLADSPVKALLKVAGRTLLDTAVEAVQGVGEVERVAIAGGDDVAQATPDGTEYVREGETVMDNVANAFTHLGGEAHGYLVISPDLPFLNASVLSEFVSTARGSCDMGLPYVSRDDFLARFPGAPNRFERLDGRQVTLGSCICMTGTFLKQNIPLFRDFFNARKFAHRVVLMLGLPIALAYLSGKLSLAALEERASRLTGGQVRGIPVPDPAIAYDIDNLVNYEHADSLLRGAESGADS